jgi:peptide chain release factor 2
LQVIAAQKEKVTRYIDLQKKYSDLLVLWELGVEEADETVEPEIETELDGVVRQLDSFELEVTLSNPYDRHNAILSLHAGAGGTEAQDWVQMLLRMYHRWAENRGYQVAIWDYLPGDEAGVKSVTIFVKGEYAYGYLKAEKGVHRLVRISPFDAAKRRHTSFASLDVIPEINREETVAINPEDIKVDTFRASGAGGQYVNKTDSAVRITHLPTGIVVQCQSERSQHANRETALRLLQSKLVVVKRQEQEKQLAQLRGEQQEIAWGSQIRSYVFHPYTLAKDHRTGTEVGNVAAVMDGYLDPFINSYLRLQARKK